MAELVTGVATLVSSRHPLTVLLVKLCRVVQFSLMSLCSEPCLPCACYRALLHRDKDGSIQLTLEANGPCRGCTSFRMRIMSIGGSKICARCLTEPTGWHRF